MNIWIAVEFREFRRAISEKALLQTRLDIIIDSHMILFKYVLTNSVRSVYLILAIV